MEWLLAIIIVLGIFTLFGWSGINAIGKFLGFIGAIIILFFIGVIGYIILKNMSPMAVVFSIITLFLASILSIFLAIKSGEFEKKKEKYKWLDRFAEELKKYGEEEKNKE